MTLYLWIHGNGPTAIYVSPRNNYGLNSHTVAALVVFIIQVLMLLQLD
jgi:hypothetical protein